MSSVRGYSAHDVEQHRLGEAAVASDADPRTAFMHDCDRILYSRAFAALAGKTQVVAVAEPGVFHTRLTHSLKVEQVGRRIAERLTLRTGGIGPSPDLVAAACLAHDIGHPPYGHAGEEALRAVFDDIAGQHPDDPAGGFEGNAQNLRILSYLESRKTRDRRGLHLSRAALDAAVKYPWQRAKEGTPGDTLDKTKKFGFYPQDAAAGEWVLRGRPEGITARPVEEEIMDWADDVTYACHDVEDFYRAGLIPLDKLIQFHSDPQWQRLPVTSQVSPSLEKFLGFVEKKWTAKNKPFDLDEAINQFKLLANIYSAIDCTLDEHMDRVRLTQATGAVITHFLKDLSLERVGDDDGPLVRYRARLVIPSEVKYLCELMKELVWFYVIDSPALASQQHGQTMMMENLLRWHFDDPHRLLPRSRLEELDEHGSVLRAVCDHIASLTEQQASQLHQRMSGLTSGAITDRLS